MLNTTDVAEHLGISRQRVHQLLVAGKLEGQRIGRSGWVITEAALNRYKKAKGRAPVTSERPQ